MSVMVKECRLLGLFLHFSILPSAAQSVIFTLCIDHSQCTEWGSAPAPAHCSVETLQFYD